MTKDVETGQSISERLRLYVAEDDIDGLSNLLDPLPRSEALRELLNLSAELRDDALEMLPAGLAAEFIEEAPTELARDRHCQLVDAVCWG